MRKVDHSRSRITGDLVDHRPAGVRQVQHRSDFVIGLAHGVVDRLADQLHVQPAVDAIHRRVPTRGDQTERGERQGVHIVLKRHAVQMRRHMIDGNQRFASGPGQRLGGSHANQQ